MSDDHHDLPNIIFGTIHDDPLIQGTDCKDWIFALAGNDLVLAGGGDDYVKGSWGSDRIVGEGGDDRLQGDSGNDTLVGQDGDDILDGGKANDRLAGGNGADQFKGGDGIDLADYTFANGGGINANLLSGIGKGHEAQGDTFESIENLTGSKYRDILAGNDGINLLKGLSGADNIYGLGGNDGILGGSGADRIDGGAGDDRIYGDARDDGLSSWDPDGANYADLFVFGKDDPGSLSGHDQIRDFDQLDTIQLWGDTEASIAIAIVGTVATITSTDGDVIDVVNHYIHTAAELLAQIDFV